MNDTTIKIRVGTSELEIWKQNAKYAGVSLSAWIRSKCTAVLYVDAEHPTAIKLENALRETYSDRHIHTATSNRMSCLCPSCTEYRQRNDLPLKSANPT